ncbi:zinc ribbon domain-containing protein, partial [Myxococcota bacterium]|nr:zinc ribbon domain-containing protein [Myxococcota bacterium]
YLHREAYQLRAGEPVPIALIPFERQAISPRLSAVAGVGLAVAAAAWLIVPLRRSHRSGDPAAPLVSEWAIERETIYENLRDLEHDHETGKIEEGDYERMRGELRAAAIDLMRQERDQQGNEATEAAAPFTPAASFCTQCGTKLEVGWRFCSNCGARVLEDGSSETT